MCYTKISVMILREPWTILYYKGSVSVEITSLLWMLPTSDFNGISLQYAQRQPEIRSSGRSTDPMWMVGSVYCLDGLHDCRKHAALNRPPVHSFVMRSRDRAFSQPLYFHDTMEFVKPPRYSSRVTRDITEMRLNENLYNCIKRCLKYHACDQTVERTPQTHYSHNPVPDWRTSITLYGRFLPPSGETSCVPTAHAYAY
jgi:hypothetical protein